MPTIMPQQELVRRAFAFVVETKTEFPARKAHDIIEEASMRFNLSPLDAEALQRLFEEERPFSPQTPGSV